MRGFMRHLCAGVINICTLWHAGNNFFFSYFICFFYIYFCCIAHAAKGNEKVARSVRHIKYFICALAEQDILPKRTRPVGHFYRCSSYQSLVCFQIGLQPQLHALQCLAARQRHVGHVRGSADMAETVAAAPAHARGHTEHLAAFGRRTPGANWPHYRTAACPKRHGLHRLPTHSPHQRTVARNIRVSLSTASEL